MQSKPVSAKSAGSAMQTLAHARLAALNERVTAPRVQVLTALLSARRPLSHQDVDQAVAGGLDRVTIYRVLDWLVTQGLAHRLAGEDRVFRYAVGNDQHAAHGHFTCSMCGTVLCMSEAPQIAQMAARLLPKGAVSRKVELNISGQCAQCAAHAN